MSYEQDWLTFLLYFTMDGTVAPRSPIFFRLGAKGLQLGSKRKIVNKTWPTKHSRGSVVASGTMNIKRVLFNCIFFSCVYNCQCPMANVLQVCITKMLYKKSSKEYYHERRMTLMLHQIYLTF